MLTDGRTETDETSNHFSQFGDSPTDNTGSNNITAVSIVDIVLTKLSLAMLESCWLSSEFFALSSSVNRIER